MSIKRVLLGVLIIILSLMLARFGEIDDSPGAFFIGIVFCIFGLYLIITSRKSGKTKEEIKKRKK